MSGVALSARERAELEHEGFGPDDEESPANRGETIDDVLGRIRARNAAREPGQVSAPTKSDNARLKREARAREREDAARYEDHDGAGRARPKAGTRPASSRPSAGRRPGVPARVAGFDTEDAGGFLLGLLAYALVINYLRGGPTQARAWLAAKFINKTASATPSSRSGQAALPNYGGSPSVGGGAQVTPSGSAGGAPGVAPAPGYITPGTTTSPPTTTLG